MNPTANLDVRIALTTIGSEADAIALAKTLVEERLAACVNVLPPMISIYRWKGSIEQDTEHQIVIKTTADRLARSRLGFDSSTPMSFLNSWWSILPGEARPTWRG